MSSQVLLELDVIEVRLAAGDHDVGMVPGRPGSGRCVLTPPPCSTLPKKRPPQPERLLVSILDPPRSFMNAVTGPGPPVNAAAPTRSPPTTNSVHNSSTRDAGQVRMIWPDGVRGGA